MLKKTCPFCQSDSYSAYDNPNWRCPYCNRKITHAISEIDLKNDNTTSKDKKGAKVYIISQRSNSFKTP